MTMTQPQRALHDTLVDLPAGTPVWFSAAAIFLPVVLIGQFLIAGFALFRDDKLWGFHTGLGMSLLIPISALLFGSLFISRLRGFVWWAGIVAVLFITQVALAAGSSPPFLALHPANGALLLCSSIVLLAKVERRRTYQSGKPNSADGSG